MACGDKDHGSNWLIQRRTAFPAGEGWLRLLGGEKVFSASPVYQLLMNERTRETKQGDILSVLEARFRAVPEALAAEVRAATDLEKLERGIRLAARCASLRGFLAGFKKA